MTIRKSRIALLASASAALFLAGCSAETEEAADDVEASYDDAMDEAAESMDDAMDGAADDTVDQADDGSMGASPGDDDEEVVF